MAAAVLPTCRRLLNGGYDFGVIDAHYLYPDGVAAVMIGRRLGRPVVMTARGTDVNVIPNYRVPRRQILSAARRSAGIVTVSHALKTALTNLGVPGERVVVLRNGVDLDLFRPMDRELARDRLGVVSPTLLSVGHLVENKGHHLVIEALTMLDGMDLVIVGDGPLKSGLRRLATSLGLGDRVRFEGSVPHGEIVHYFNAADALVLASDREGMPNVVLESIACGTPVIATRTGGVPEIVEESVAGEFAKERTSRALADAVGRLFAEYPSRARVRAYAERFDWDSTTRGLTALMIDAGEDRGS
jgi:glycosyltransferase involved in cell wall biosynthesis